MSELSLVVGFEVPLDRYPDRHVEQREHREDGDVDRKLGQLLRMHAGRREVAHDRSTKLGNVLTVERHMVRMFHFEAVRIGRKNRMRIAKICKTIAFIIYKNC